VDAYMIVFRIIHIASAILWAGSAIFYTAFVGPTVETLGPEAGRFFSHLVRQRKAVVFFLVVSTLDIDWIQTGVGTGFTVGAIAGVIAWLVVVGVLAPTSYRLTALGQQLSAAGGAPSQEQTASLQTLQSRLKAFSLITIASLGIAALAMATARYLGV
jgi:hypothetical protein